MIIIIIIIYIYIYTYICIAAYGQFYMGSSCATPPPSADTEMRGSWARPRPPYCSIAYNIS